MSTDPLKNISFPLELWSLMEGKLVGKVGFIFPELWTSSYFQFAAKQSHEPPFCSIPSI